MRNIVLFILAIAGALLLGSCSESFLDSKPLTQLTEADFYKTPADAELALVGCYDGLQRLDATTGAFPICSDWLSDDCFGGTGATDGYWVQALEEFNKLRSPGDVNMFSDLWINYYQAIYRVNMLLTKMDLIDFGTNTALKNSIESQARFLRAYFYFDLVRLFEKVPLLTEPTSENVPQASADEIYAQITDDLLFAAENGSATVSPGRANKWAAKAYIARVYQFYTGYYEKSDLVGKVTQAQALAGLEEVIGSDNYELVEEFKNLWIPASTTINEAGTDLVSTYAGKDNDETIFAIKHNITSDYDGNTDGNHWVVMNGLRSQSFPPYGKGWGSCTVPEEFYNAFEADDERRDASIIGIEEEDLDFDPKDQREYTGYATKKYIPVAIPDGTDFTEENGAVNFMIGQFNDYVIMRYADVLLMAAELGSTNAQDYFDQVRERAGLTSKTVNSANLMAERRFEFAFEGIRYWDLLRQGLDVAAATVEVNIDLLSGGAPETKVILGSNLQKTRGFQQIPNNQITLSGGVLKQNAGW